MPTVTERLELLVDAKTGGAISEIRKLNASVEETEAATKKTGTATGFLQTKMESMGLSSAAAATVMSTALPIAAAAAGAAFVKFGKDSVDATIHLADGIRLVQQATGANAETSSRLVAIMDDYSISAESGAKSFAKLGVNLAGNEDKLKSYGVEVVKTKDHHIDLEKTIENIAEAYKTSGDAAEKDKLVLDAFGKSGRDLIPILEQGRSGIEKMFANVPQGQIFSQQQIDEARRYQLAVDDLHDVMLELKVAVGNAVIPTLASLIQVTAAAARGFTLLLEAATALDEKTGGTGLFDNLFSVTAKLASKVAEGPGGIWKDVDQFAEATKRATEAEKHLVEVTTESGHSTQEVAKAQRDYRDAKGELANMTDKATAALDKENEKLRTNNEQSREAISLANTRINMTAGLLGADLNYQEALGKREFAQIKVNQLEAEGKTNTLEYAAAKQDLQRADLAVVQSTLAVEDQVRSLKDQVKAGSLSYEDYQHQIDVLKFKYPGFATAIDNVTGSVHTLHGEIDGVPDKDVKLTASDGVTEVANAAKWSIGTVPFFHHTEFTASDGVTSVANGIKWSIGEAQGAVAKFLGPKMQHGGPIPGGPNDPYPIIAHGGEYVLSADVVDRIKTGRQSRGAAPPSFATWSGGGDTGGSGGPQVIQLVVSGRVLAEVTAAEFARAGGPQMPTRAIAG